MGRLQMRTYDGHDTYFASVVAVAMGQSRGGRSGSFLTPLPCVDIGLKLCGGGDISKIN